MRTAARETALLADVSPDCCGLYVSVPFCPTRCAYCSFVSYSNRKLFALIPDYLDKLLGDIRETADLISSLGLRLSAVYIGGGTPSILDAAQTERLFSALSDCAERFGVPEFTYESGRPDTTTAEKLAVAKRCGVNRVSINPQSTCDAVLERMIGFWLALPSTADAADAQTFIDRYVTFSEVNAEADLRQTATAVFLGKTLLLAEGYGECILIDAKSYPSRGVEEPSSGKVLRGAHDGFIETLVQNAALLRRRIRTPQLTLEGHKISEKSRADVVLCYLKDKVDRALLARVRAKLAAIDADSISMSQESIAESMMDRRQWFNPFPRVRYTERPDAATASIMEGSIIVLVDNSPAAMILPTRFFDFVQEANDFYFPPLVGSYLRILRVVVFLLTLFITPVWYLLVQDPDLPNSALSFLAVTSECEVPILAQLLLTEFIVDLLKLASLNTPSVFSNSFSMIGALVLGDFAVQAHWLVPEVLAYMAFVAIANFAQPSYELGYAFKLLRLVLLVSSAALGWVGLALGTLLIIVLLVTTRPIAGGHYMYPIYPFNWHALRALLIRRPIAPDNT